MKRMSWVLFLTLPFLFLGVKMGAAADQTVTNEKVLDAVKQELSNRAQISGTVDIYDGKINKVRNLKIMAVSQDVTKNGNGYLVAVDSRDATTGDAVSLTVNVGEKDGVLTVQTVAIDKVSAKKAADANKVYSDDEVQALMKDYLKTQAKFTGHLMLYDDENKKMRNLDLVNLDPKVRRLGILYISRAQYKDIDSGDLLGVDVTIENQNGQLNVQSLRIREIKKP